MTLREVVDDAGFAVRRRALDAGQLATLAALMPPTHAARNLLWEQPGLPVALEYTGIDALASEVLDRPAIPVSAIFLDKTLGANWKVPGHQDLVVPVERQVDEPGFTGWTTKRGTVHVQPPREVLERLIAVRIHLDDCPAENGALAVVPGSHRRGVLGDADLQAIPPGAFRACAAAAGDALIMKPLLVHRSSPAVTPAHRRVLHVVYAADQPGRQVRWKEAPGG
jgi:hypothetical protein